LAIFSDEINDCGTLNDCIRITKDQIEKFTDYCNCSNVNESNIIDCYLNSPGNIDGKYIYDKKILNKILNIIENQMDSNNNMLYQSLENKFSTIIQKMKNKKGPLITELNGKEINEYIIKNLAIKTQEKDEFGEVFTPPDLIEEMIRELPKSVWKNKDYKWLDPANGQGNFPMIVYFELMKELDSVPLSKRSEHIIKNMLYMVELNPKNVKISRKIFGEDANIVCMSFLSEDYKSVNPKVIKKFGIEKFDVIMGNPPFNKEKEEKRKGGYGGNEPLWELFVTHSVDLLNTGGILGFIHPCNWRGPEHELGKLMFNKQIKYLHIYSEKEGEKHFNGIKMKFDLYVLINSETTEKTKIIDELGVENNINLNNISFLPNYAYKEINNIRTTKDKGIEIIYSTIYHTQPPKKGPPKVIKNKKKPYIHPVIHEINNKGIGCWYTDDTTKGHFRVQKFILNKGRYQYSYEEQNDYNGNYGMSQTSFGIPIKSKKEGAEILKVVQSDAFKKIIAATKWGVFNTDYKMFKYFKKDFYKHPMFKQKTPSKTRSNSKSNSPDNKTKKSNNAGKVINRKTIKKPKNKKKRRTIKRKFWF